MKKLSFLFCLIFIICTSINLTAQIDETHILVNDSPSFSIDFPAKYTIEESSDDNGLQTKLFRCEYKNDIYMFKFTEHKSSAVSGDNASYMDASLESFIIGIKGTLIKRNLFRFGKISGLDAFISLDNKNSNVFYRVLIIKKVQYQIIVITKDEGKSKSVNAFFNSFTSPVK